MKAITQDRYGPPEVLEYKDIEQPVPGPHEVLVRVRAASVNARDWHVMRGDPYVARLMDRSTFGRRAPRNPVRGTDFAGTVEAVGPAVTRLRVGDEVFGESEGAFAELVCAPEDVVAVRPEALPVEQAAALPLAGNTALLGLRHVRPGDRVLVNGASGGVGTFAVQLAKAAGATVTAVCGPRNTDLVRSLGADMVIDRTRTDFTASGERHDTVFDLVGNRSLRALGRAVDPNGTLVLSGGGTSRGGSIIGPVALIIRGMAASRFVRHRLVVLNAAPTAANLAELAGLTTAGTITPVIDRTYPLSDAAAAIRYMETEHARAKLVLTV
ncbi:MAG TPA: NAD(P)-dependent alcohol dehydrogenase [Pseudonocardiaceae bacterium]